jgi:hypothetical protein
VTALRLLLLNAAGAAAAAVAARAIGRPLPTRILLLFALLPVLFLWPGVVASRAPLAPHQAFLTLPDTTAQGPSKSAWLDDIVHQIVPWHVAVRRAWASGELPLRNAWNGCGTVLDANGQSAAFSPMTALGFLLPPLSALSLWGALRLFLCLAGMWLWLTEMSISSRAAVFGAMAFGLSLAMTGWIFFPLTASLCLWPWALSLLERLIRGASRRRAVIGLVAVLALWPASGHAETIASAAGFTAVWLAARAALGERRPIGRLLAPASGAALLALGLSAFTLLPQISAVLASNRLAIASRPFWKSILSVVPHGAEWKNGLLVILFPRIFGDGIAMPMLPGAAGAFPEMAQGYAGVLAAALVLLVLKPGSPRAVAEKALLLPAVLGVGAAVGLWPFAEIVSALPLLSRLLPLRLLTWWALAAAAIAAFELDRLERDVDERRAARIWPIASVALVLVLAFTTWRRARGLYVAAGALDAGREEFLLPVVTLAAALAILLATVGRAKRLRDWGIPLLSIAAGTELFIQGTRLYLWNETSRLFPVTPLVERLRKEPGPFRVIGEGAILFPNVNVIAGVEDVRTHDATERREYVEFLDAAAGYEPTAYFKQIADLDAPVLDFLNVRYLVAYPGRAAPSSKWESVYSGPDGTIFRNSAVLPRVFAPDRIRQRTESADRAVWKTFDWRAEAVLGEGLEVGLGAGGGRNGRAEVLDYRETGDAVSFRARCPEGRGALLVASLVNDGGWRARDEAGNVLPAGRVNGPFLAVLAPPGEHRIRLDYAPPGFREGVVVSALSLALALVLLATSRRRGHP